MHYNCSAGILPAPETSCTIVAERVEARATRNVKQRFTLSLFVFVLIVCFSVLSESGASEKIVSTFSIVAYDPETGDLGVAVQSKFPNVRPVVPWAKAGVGAVATQAFANTSYGERGLALLENGATPQEAIDILTSSDPNREQRQVGIVDAKGRSATFTGKDCFNWAGGKAYTNFAVQGNILVSGNVV